MTQQSAPAQKDREKTKYTCSGCGANVFGKPGLNLRSDVCNQVLQSVYVGSRNGVQVAELPFFRTKKTIFGDDHGLITTAPPVR